MKKFSVQYWSTREPATLEISEEEFESIKAAKQTLVAAFAVEEKYDCLLSNYIELEQDATSMMIDNIVKSRIGYRGAYELRRRMNIRMLNFLSSARMYVDHIKHDVKECMNGSKEAKEEAKRILSVQFDANKYYRFMEGLRNYTQHYSLPVHWTVDGAQWSNRDGKKHLRESTFEFFADVRKIEESGKVRKDVLSEFQDKVDLKLASRSYLESLSHANERIREYIDPEVNRSRELIVSFLARHAALCEGQSDPVIARWVEGDRVVEQINLNMEWEDVRSVMRTENPELVSFTCRYVSTLTEGVEASFEESDTPDV